MLTGPHQISSLLPSSYTIRLSLGDRPVFLPEKLISAPVDEMTAPSFRMASSYSEAMGAFRWLSARGSPRRNLSDNADKSLGGRNAHLDVDTVQVKTGLREVLELLAEELVGLFVVMSVGSHVGV